MFGGIEIKIRIFFFATITFISHSLQRTVGGTDIKYAGQGESDVVVFKIVSCCVYTHSYLLGETNAEVEVFSTVGRDVGVYRWRCGGVEVDAWSFGGVQ